MPIVIDGEVVGAIGVSGARSADEDQELAVIGAGSASANGHRNGVAHFPRAQVDSGRGILLDEGRFKLDAGRRTGPGEVELHEHAIDVMHVVKGTATVVTAATRRTRSPRATCSRSPRASPTSSPRCPIRSCTSS